MMHAAFAVIVMFFSFTSAGFGQVQGGGDVPIAPIDPVPFLSFQELLWDDLWGATFVTGEDGLMSVQPASDPTHILHRLDWDPAENFLDGEIAAGTMTGVQVWDMDWFEDDPHSAVVILADDSEWSGTIDTQIYAFSGQISSGGGYEPFIFGVLWELNITEGPAAGGQSYVYSMWVPLGRAGTAAAASQAAEEIAFEVVLPPSPTVTQPATCASIYSGRAFDNANDYLIGIEACGGDGMTGAGVGAGIGVGIGGAGAGIPGAATGAGIGAVFGWAIDKFTGRSKCLKEATENYNKNYRRNWRCYQECLTAGQWTCG